MEHAWLKHYLAGAAAEVDSGCHPPVVAPFAACFA